MKEPLNEAAKVFNGYSIEELAESTTNYPSSKEYTPHDIALQMLQTRKFILDSFEAPGGVLVYTCETPLQRGIALKVRTRAILEAQHLHQSK